MIIWRSFSEGATPCHPVEEADPSSTIEKRPLLTVSPSSLSLAANLSVLLLRLPPRLWLFLDPDPTPPVRRFFSPVSVASDLSSSTALPTSALNTSVVLRLRSEFGPSELSSACSCCLQKNGCQMRPTLVVVSLTAS